MSETGWRRYEGQPATGWQRVGDMAVTDGTHAGAQPQMDDVAVIFTSWRNGQDETGYRAAAAAMEELATRQPGFRGMHSARGADGFGITVSYWADAAAAIAWRDQPDHRATRERGRERWYHGYAVTVADVARAYHWSRS